MQNQFLPLQGIRVLERSNTLAVRLAGLLLADQRADVFALDHGRLADGEIDAYLNRGKKLLHPHVLASIQDSDIVIQNGPILDHHSDRVISLGFTSTVPGDPDLNLPDDPSDDLLNPYVGFYTDLGVTSRLLGRDVILHSIATLFRIRRRAGSYGRIGRLNRSPKIRGGARHAYLRDRRVGESDSKSMTSRARSRRGLSENIFAASAGSLLTWMTGPTH